MPNDTSLMRRARNEFQPRRWFPSLISGLLVGTVMVSHTITFALLIFSSALATGASAGIGMALVSGLTLSIIVALTSSTPGMVAYPQELPPAVLAILAASIVRTMPASATADDKLMVVVATIMLSGVFTGAVFLVFGRLKLARLVRFLPYPVVGGFLAGIGWLLAKDSLSMMVGSAADLAQFPGLFRADALLHWLPGIVFGFLFFFLTRRYQHFLMAPGLLLAAITLFFIMFRLTNTSRVEAARQGWLLGPFPTDGLWQPINYAVLLGIDWSLILNHPGTLATIALVSLIGMLLNCTAIEVGTRRDIDLDRDLQAVGTANLVSGLIGGGFIGYPSISMTLLPFTLGARRRLVGIFAATMFVLVLLFGESILSVVPRPVVGGLLFSVGLSFLAQWIYEGWSKFPRVDYFVVILIMIVMGSAGFLQGVSVGVVAAVILFVVRYSRINVVRHALSGANYQSRVTRSRLHRQLLRRNGEQIYILQLQGFLFFGTAHGLLGQVRQRMQAPHLPHLHWVVLDFRQVPGLDSTALLSFANMKQLAEAHNITLVFTNLTAEIQRQFEKGGLGPDREGVCQMFPDLDHGVEWCENQLLIALGVALNDDHQTVREQLENLMPGEADVNALLTYFERQSIARGHYLIRQGDPAEELYLLEGGQLTARIEHPNAEPVRLETMRGGHVVGELGFYLGTPRSASVVADEPCTVYRLSERKRQEMQNTNPELASAFHQMIVHLLAERVIHLSTSVRALQS